MNYETSTEIEIAVSKYFNPRQNIIVPNVWWGLCLSHECDLLVLTKAGYGYEIEIKVSKADLKADLKKTHGHVSNKLRKIYFALPEKLKPNVESVPEKAGILIVNKAGKVSKIREAQYNTGAQPLSDRERLKIAHLGSMRIWRLKSKIVKMGNKL